MNKIKPEVWFIIIILFALVLRMYFFLGLNLNDDLCYVNLANDIIEGRFNFNDWIFTPRLLMHFPIALFFIIFGVSNFSAAFYILLCSMGSVVLTYYIGKLLFNKKVALVSTFFMSIFPVEVIYATTIVPDVPVAFFMGLSIYLFLLGEKKNKNIFYILSGIAVGLAWLVKSLSVLIFLFFFFYFIIDKVFDFRSSLYKKSKKRYKNKFDEIFKIRKVFMLFLVGFLIILFLEGTLYFFTNDDFLLRFRAETGHYVSSLLGVNTNLEYYPAVLLGLNDPQFNFFGLFFYFALLSILFIIFRGDKKSLILLIWLLPVLLYMQYGTMNPFEYTLIQRIYRFLTIITIPTCLIVGYFLIENKLSFKNSLLVASIFFLLFTSLFYVYKINFFMAQSMLDFQIAAEYLEKYPNTIYSDPDTVGKLNFLLGYKRTDDLKNIMGIKNPNEIKDAFVVVDASRGYVELSNLKSSLPGFIWDVPENWQLVKVIKESYLGYYGHYDTKIYYVG